MRNILILSIGLILVALGGVFFFTREPETLPVPEAEIPPEETIVPIHTETLGTSHEERPIELVTFGTGKRFLLFVGGVHGGYEWNSSLLAYEMIDFFTENIHTIPESVTVGIIPVLNPDGLFMVTGKEGRFSENDVRTDLPVGTGRFNARTVDLNRNFDCKWNKEAVWRGTPVSSGTEAFSEKESQVLRALVERRPPSGVVFWHSKAHAVYASECHEGVLPETRRLMNTYGEAVEYPMIDVFDSYPVTGDAEGWLAALGIPAITVELATHESTEFDTQRRGVESVIDAFSE